MYSFKYNQQDATLYSIRYYCQCSTCFRRFLRPSSGAQNCTHSIWYLSSLLAATDSVGEMERQLQCFVTIQFRILLSSPLVCQTLKIKTIPGYILLCIAFHIAKLKAEHTLRGSHCAKSNRMPENSAYDSIKKGWSCRCGRMTYVHISLL
jgi:hypothetical protein